VQLLTEVTTMSTSPSAAHSLERLLRSGWSVSESATDAGRKVSATQGGHRIVVTATTRAEAFHQVCQQAEALGLLAGTGRA
jgi:hypothetical protein